MAIKGDQMKSSVAKSFILGICGFLLLGSTARAIWGVGDIVSDPGHTAATMAGWMEQGTNMALDLNQGLQQLNTAVDQLTFFGDPSKVASLVGLDGLLGGDSALGGLMGNSLKLGNSVFSTFDEIQQLGGRGMQLYSMGQTLMDGDVLNALNQMGLGSVGNLVGIESVMGGYSSGVSSYGQLNSMSQAAWSNVAGALRQVRTATTDQEIQKAQANLNAQLQYANSLTDRQSADQAILSTSFQAEEAQQRYSQLRKDQVVVNAFYKAMGLTPPVEESALRDALKKKQ